MALSLLMVSSIKFYSFKDLHFLTREPFMTVVLAVILLIIVLAEPQVMVFAFAAGYAISGPIWGILMLIKRMFTPGEKAADDRRRGDQNGNETRGDLVIEDKPDHGMRVA